MIREGLTNLLCPLGLLFLLREMICFVVVFFDGLLFVCYVLSIHDDYGIGLNVSSPNKSTRRDCFGNLGSVKNVLRYLSVCYRSQFSQLIYFLSVVIFFA